MSKAGQNEARKNTAAFLNGIALLVLGVGCVGPAVTSARDMGGSVVVSLLASAVAIILHSAARSFVHRVED